MDLKMAILNSNDHRNLILARWHACETSPEPSTRGVVGIAQDVRLKLQILQSMLDDIADADDTG